MRCKKRVLIIAAVSAFLMYINSYNVSASQEVKEGVSTNEIQEVEQQIKELDKKIDEFQKSMDSKADKDVYNTILTERDTIYARVLDGVKAQADSSNNKVNFIFGALSILLAAIGVWWYYIKKKMDKKNEEVEEKIKAIEQKSKEAIESAESINKTVESAEINYKQIASTLEEALKSYGQVADASKGAETLMKDLQEKKIDLETLNYELAAKKEELREYISEFSFKLQDFKNVIDKLSGDLGPQDAKEAALEIDMLNESLKEFANIAPDENTLIITEAQEATKERLKDLDDDSFLEERDNK